MTAAPPGYRSVSAYLVVPEAEAVMAFAKTVFDAREVAPPVHAGDLWWIASRLREVPAEEIARRVAETSPR